MDLTQILLDAQNPTDRNRRLAAEAEINRLQRENLPVFLLMLVAEMANKDKPQHSRFMAGLILKNTMDAKERELKEQLRNQWVSLDSNTRAQIKATALSTLAAPVPEARSASAQVISKIALIELPRGQWNELIDILMEHSTSMDPNLKQASLTTLGYICEDSDPQVIQPFSNKILTAVISGMRKEEPNDEVRIAASSAFFHILQLIKGNMEVDNERNYIMQVVCEGTRANNAKIRANCYAALAEIGGLYYSYLTPYMQAIFTLTIQAIREDEEAVANQAIEFWSTICEEELDLIADAIEAAKLKRRPRAPCLNFIAGALRHLVPELLQSLTRQKEYQSDTASLSATAATCLSLVASVVQDDIVPVVLPFVQQHINNPNWHFKEAATLALGSILEGPQSTDFLRVLTEGLPVLIAHLREQHEKVKDTTAWAIGRIIELHEQAVIPHLQTLIETLLVSLKDTPRVAANVCWALHNLAMRFSDQLPNGATRLSPFFNTIVASLLATADRNDAAEDNLRPSAYEAINLMIQNAGGDVIGLVEQLVPHFMAKLEATFAMDMLSMEEKSELQGLLCGVLQACIVRLEDRITEVEVIDKMMLLFLQVFHYRNSSSVHEEALMAVGAIANAMESRFERYLPSFMPILINALRNFHEHQVCAVAIGILGDVCRAVNKKIAVFCNDIINILISNLQEPLSHRAIKPPIISCFGDIALAIGGEAFEPYFPRVIHMIEAASVTLATDPEDFDFIDWLNVLREEIFEAYTGLLQGLRAGGKAELMLPHVPHLLQFIEVVWQDPNRNEAVSRGAVGVLGDLAHSLGQKVKQFLLRPVVQVALGELLQQGSKQSKDVAKWSQSIIAKYLH